MDFALIGALLGAITGSLIAYRRKGKLADILQYGFVFAVIFALAGLFIALIILRSTV